MRVLSLILPLPLAVVWTKRPDNPVPNHFADQLAGTLSAGYFYRDIFLSHKEVCLDEYYESKSEFRTHRFSPLFNSLELSPCGLKVRGIPVDPLPPLIDEYVVEPHLNCDHSKNTGWVRLDCKFTKGDDSDPIYVSRSAKKRTVTRKARSGDFLYRIKCEDQPNTIHTTNECRSLLFIYLSLDEEAKRLALPANKPPDEKEDDNAHGRRHHKKRRAAAKADDRDAEKDAKSVADKKTEESSSSESPSSGSIALIVVGCVILVAGGVAIYMYSRKKTPLMKIVERPTCTRAAAAAALGERQ